MFENLTIKLNSYSDRILTLTGMTWDDYEIYSAQQSSYRISFLNNVINIVSPSRNHERIAQTISILINAYCRKYKIPYFALGSKDIKKAGVAAKQPDASYCFQREKDTPDLAVEVNYTSGSINDLEKYRLLNAPEVWLWQDDLMTFYVLENDSYIDRYRSFILPKINSDFLNQYAIRGLTENNLTIETEFFTALK